MSSRRQAREYALQALYQWDISGTSGRVSLDGLWQGLVDGDGIQGSRPGDEDEIAFAERLVLGVEAQHERIDALLEEVSTNWRVKRMPAVDRNILRIAVFELMDCPEVPASVAMNEAIEIGKRFGTADSRAVINGIVDRVARQVGRADEGGAPARRRSKPRAQG